MTEGGEIAKKVPVIGAAINKGLGLGADVIVENLVDSDREFTPAIVRHSDGISTTISHYTDFLNAVYESDNPAISELPDEEFIDELEELRVVSRNEDGTLDFESDSSKWNLVDGDDRAVYDALNGALDDTTLNPEGRNENNAIHFYGEYDQVYQDAYDDIMGNGRR